MVEWGSVIEDVCPYGKLRLQYTFWRAMNPVGYKTWFLRRAEMCVRTGQRMGSRWFVEDARYISEQAEFKKQYGYKISNNHSPYIGRDLINDVPLLLPKGLIIVKETKEEKWYRKPPNVLRPQTHLILVFKKIDNDDPLSGLVLA